MAAIHLKDMPRKRLRGWLQEAGFQGFRADQLFEWIWRHGRVELDTMANLPRRLRAHLASQSSLHSGLSVARQLQSSDGTRKLLVGLEDGLQVEAVILADRERRTLCASSQVGCAMGCDFCYTARSKVRRNMSTREIVAQFELCNTLLAEAGEPALSNIVFMGMGEPLANVENLVAALQILTDARGLAFSARKITVSTVGLVPHIPRLVPLGVHLAISLNASNDALREQLMPIEKHYPLVELVAAAAGFARESGRRVTFEYVLLGGVNDQAEHARELVRLLNHVRYKVNLIPFNEFPGSGYRAPLEEDVAVFQGILRSKGVDVFRRRSRGRDILAACGQLAGKGEGAV